MHRKIAAFNAQDAHAIRALLSPDVEWVIPGGPLRGPRSGAEAGVLRCPLGGISPTSS
ncbi:MAG: nuclear transport factor 2 family protein [Pseudonocardiaceae bacterium]